MADKQTSVSERIAGPGMQTAGSRIFDRRLSRAKSQRCGQRDANQ